MIKPTMVRMSLSKRARRMPPEGLTQLQCAPRGFH